MTYRTKLLAAACVISLAVAVAGCGEKSAAVKTAGETGKPAAESKPIVQAPDAAKNAPASGLPGLDPSGGLGNLLNPLAAGEAPKAQGDVLTPNLKSKPPVAPVKPIPANARPEPKQLMQIVQQAYRAARAIKVEGSSSTTVKVDGKVVQSQKGDKFTTTFKSPDKFILASDDSTLTCDGKNVTIYAPAAKRYQKMPFSQEFARSLVYSKPGVGMMGLAFGVDYTEAISSYKLLPDSKIAGQSTFVLQVKFKKGAPAMGNADVTQTLWIGKKDMAIYKNQVIAVEKPVRPKDYKGEFPSKVETTIVGTVTRYTPNPKLADSAFAFKAPAGAKAIEPPKEINLLGKAAPDFAFAAADGSASKLSDLRGSPVMLVFWALPMPEEQVELMQSAYTKHKDDTRILAINLNPDREKTTEFMNSKGYSFPVIFGDEAIAKVAVEKYGIRGFPSMLLIDKSGVVRLATIGIPEPDDLNAKLAKYTPGD